jgi:hypothetical protein
LQIKKGLAEFFDTTGLHDSPLVIRRLKRLLFKSALPFEPVK